VAGLLALAVGMGIGRFAFTPILPMMQEDAGLSIAMGGWLASANYVGYLLGALSVMGLRMRASSALRAGLVAIGLATLAMGLDGGLVWWLVLRAIAGVASALVLINVSAWCLERLAALGRVGLTNTVFAGVGAGIVLAGGLCLALMHAGAGSSRAWTVLGAISLALAVGIWPAFRRDGSAPPSPERAETRAVAWDRESLRLVLCYGALGVALPVVWSSIVAVMLAGLLVGGTFMVITMIGMQEARSVAGTRATGLMAALTSAFAVGQIAGPIVVSYVVVAGGGFSAALLVAGAVLLLSAYALS